MIKQSFRLFLVFNLFLNLSSFSQENPRLDYQYNGNVATLIKNKTTYNDYKRLYECHYADGSIATAQFCRVAGAAVNSKGEFFISDAGNKRIRKINRQNQVSTFAGSGKDGERDGSAAEAEFSVPGTITIDANDNLYILDGNVENVFFNDKSSIRKITPAGEVTTLLTSKQEFLVGEGLKFKFKRINHIVSDKEGNIFFTAEKENMIFKLGNKGGVNVFAGNKDKGMKNGDIKEARFANPSGICFDAANNMIVADVKNNAIRKISLQGEVTTIYSKKESTGKNTIGGKNLVDPYRVALDNLGNIIVTGKINEIMCIQPDGVLTSLAGGSYVAGSLEKGGTLYRDGGFKDGYAQEAQFLMPGDICFDKDNNMYVIDANGLRSLRVSKTSVKTESAGRPTPSQTPQINGKGVLKLVAGGAGSTMARMKDGYSDNAEFSSSIVSLTELSDNCIYLADAGNHCIRKISLNGNVSTIAGKYETQGKLLGEGLIGKRGYADGAAAAAMFDTPTGIAADSHGNLFITDRYNHLIRKLSKDGIVSTFSGNGSTGKKSGGYKDGRPEEALFNEPMGITIDKNDNLYIADAGNAVIRKITPTGFVSTFCGTATPGKNTPGVQEGMPGAAKFNRPEALATWGKNGLVICDRKASIIFACDSSGRARFLSGQGNSANMGKGFESFADGNIAEALFKNPVAITTDLKGNIYISDRGNSRIRKIERATNSVSTLFSVDMMKKSPQNDVIFFTPGGICLTREGTIYVVEDKYINKLVF